MSTAGYSGTPLPKKLGIKEGSAVLLVKAPDGFAENTLGELPMGARILADGDDTRPDVVILFAIDSATLFEAFAGLADRLPDDGGLWVGWPKKSSKVPTDLNFDVVQRHGLDNGLVDNKVCAIDETWSGLRFVYRIADRGKR